MTEEEQEAFYRNFLPDEQLNNDTSLVAFCVMGDLFRRNRFDRRPADPA